MGQEASVPEDPDQLEEQARAPPSSTNPPLSPSGASSSSSAAAATGGGANAANNGGGATGRAGIGIGVVGVVGGINPPALAPPGAAVTAAAQAATKQITSIFRQGGGIGGGIGIGMGGGQQQAPYQNGGGGGYNGYDDGSGGGSSNEGIMYGSGNPFAQGQQYNDSYIVQQQQYQQYLQQQQQQQQYQQQQQQQQQQYQQQQGYYPGQQQQPPPPPPLPFQQQQQLHNDGGVGGGGDTDAASYYSAASSSNNSAVSAASTAASSQYQQQPLRAPRSPQRQQQQLQLQPQQPRSPPRQTQQPQQPQQQLYGEPIHSQISQASSSIQSQQSSSAPSANYQHHHNHPHPPGPINAGLVFEKQNSASSQNSGGGGGGGSKRGLFHGGGRVAQERGARLIHSMRHLNIGQAISKVSQKAKQAGGHHRNQHGQQQHATAAQTPAEWAQQWDADDDESSEDEEDEDDDDDESAQQQQQGVVYDPTTGGPASASALAQYHQQQQQQLQQQRAGSQPPLSPGRGGAAAAPAAGHHHSIYAGTLPPNAVVDGIVGGPYQPSSLSQMQQQQQQPQQAVDLLSRPLPTTNDFMAPRISGGQQQQQQPPSSQIYHQQQQVQQQLQQPPPPPSLLDWETSPAMQMMTAAPGGVEDAKPNVQMFLPMLRVLGKGSFGKVVLVQKRVGKERGQLFAMKILRKTHLVKRRQIERTRTERKVLSVVNHPFIMKLHYAFQSDDKLYLVLDYCPGGELFFHLSRFRRFPERVARFYAAELLLAIGHLHKRGIIYRDLKPENVLLDADGHVKLGDFGLAKAGIQHPYEGAISMCGTPEYMAPEVLSQQGHGFCVDYWGLGMLTYEMMTGLPPWYTTDRSKLFKRLKSAPLDIPSFFSSGAADCVSGLLERNPRRRLGVTGIRSAMEHEFFRAISWRSLYARRVEAPIRPCEGWKPPEGVDSPESSLSLQGSPGRMNYSPNQSMSTTATDISKLESHELDAATTNFDSNFTRMPVESEDQSSAGLSEEDLAAAEELNADTFLGFTFDGKDRESSSASPSRSNASRQRTTHYNTGGHPQQQQYQYGSQQQQQQHHYQQTME